MPHGKTAAALWRKNKCQMSLFCRLFQHQYLSPAKGAIDGFAIGVAGVTFLALQRFHIPIHVVILLGALSGMLWKLYV